MDVKSKAVKQVDARSFCLFATSGGCSRQIKYQAISGWNCHPIMLPPLASNRLLPPQSSNRLLHLWYLGVKSPLTTSIVKSTFPPLVSRRLIASYHLSRQIDFSTGRQIDRSPPHFA
ncbi:unnamed protein product [Orchesella dallaii]|uniref:Uncharacterized protein n=1 Tax=Orchesella dallaii TaxID=48710 RepID=A0ABP1PPL0_9HEXA